MCKLAALATISMPYTSIYIHAIWSTKNREKLITPILKSSLLDFLLTYAKEKNIHIDCVNCVSDHIHMLISLKPDQAIANVIGLLKGASSFRVNKDKLTPLKFEWQDDYLAFSVSLSSLAKVRNYIANQEAHHAKKTFNQEYQQFLEAHGLSK